MDDNSLETHSSIDVERQVDAIHVERSIVKLIIDLTKSLKNNQEESIDYYKNSLSENLGIYLKEWQFRNDEKEGLNSGAVGEAVAHLVGENIFADFPTFKKGVIRDLDKEMVISKPQDINNENHLIELNLNLKEEGDYYLTTLQINGNINLLESRMAHLDNQFDLITSKPTTKHN